MRVLIFLSSIVFVVVAVAALPLSVPGEAVAKSPMEAAYGR
ncbi:hypothetical protein ACFQ4O_14785 [Methylopila musalis]|uniref:Uncharacterized protein n=1 Tax=Methylopila musalis TaxID=1134781 RepID=A0ABW3ZAG0_9HYPH